ncbi:MAG: polyprenyl synthetase family protein [Clostridia bacterium]|nr:polyprenyl synthetase family protein [Clostridia bacterium]MBR2926312.1 polyprenyl synthetase family protein [Clostridia bacterium]
MTHEVLELMLHRDAVMTENAMKGYYTEDPDIGVLLDAERYSLFAGGKRIRPALCLAFCRLFGGEDEAALPFACAVEMIHTYSLIHDDLPCMDNDDLRRGKPTNHRVYGEANALLAGDSLLTGAFEVAATNPHTTAEINALAVAYLASCAGRYGMVGGQIMDLEGEKKQLTLDELLKLHSLKTGALINAACVMGALAAGVSLGDARMKDVVTYAENIGLAFQIVDDVLDEIGDSAELGKNVGVDAERNKNTFLTFYSVKEAQFYAEEVTAIAVRAIQKYPDSEALRTLAEWLCTRKK